MKHFVVYTPCYDDITDTASAQEAYEAAYLFNDIHYYEGQEAIIRVNELENGQIISFEEITADELMQRYSCAPVYCLDDFYVYKTTDDGKIDIDGTLYEPEYNLSLYVDDLHCMRISIDGTHYYFS